MENFNYRNKSYRTISKIVFTSVLIVVLVTALFVFAFNTVFALEDTNSAVKAGGGAELWDNEAHSFNQSVIKDLQSKLFGNENPVEYIENNYDQKEFRLTNSKIIPATIVNAKVGSSQYGMTITLGGKEWMLTSLTLADTPSKKNNVVLTLYLSKDDGNTPYLDDGNGNDDIKGRNMYSSSAVRNQLLTQSNWTMFNRGYFAEEFLLKPKYINYQLNQTYKDRNNAYDYKNDALGTPESLKWYSPDTHSPYTPDYVVNGIRYDDWGEDFIWLPSMIETGAFKSGASDSVFSDKDCIWKLSDSQRKYSGNRWSWVRSGYHNDYYHVGVLGSNAGVFNAFQVYSSQGIRPAIHLNLSAILEEEEYGIVPNQNSKYDYQYLDKDQVRHSYSDINYRHGINDLKATKIVLGNIHHNTKVDEFVGNLSNANSLLKIYDNKGNLIYDKGVEVVSGQIIGTGYKIELYNGSNVIDTVYLSVLGDVNGDGRITASDVAYLRQLASDKALYNGLNIEKKFASLIINKGGVTSADAEIVRNVIDNLIQMYLFF